MPPRGELNSSRPKVYCSRGSMICLALAFRGFLLLIAILAVGGFGYFSWRVAQRNGQPTPWLIVGGSAIAVLLFAVGGIFWARKMIGLWGQKVTLDADGVSLAHGRQTCRFAWGEIVRIDRNDHLDEQSNSDGIVVGLAQNYWGWLSLSTMTIHGPDGRKIVVTPFLDRYDELCGYVLARQKRAAKNQSAGE